MQAGRKNERKRRSVLLRKKTQTPTSTKTNKDRQRRTVRVYMCERAGAPLHMYSARSAAQHTCANERRTSQRFHSPAAQDVNSYQKNAVELRRSHQHSLYIPPAPKEASSHVNAVGIKSFSTAFPVPAANAEEASWLCLVTLLCVSRMTPPFGKSLVRLVGARYHDILLYTNQKTSMSQFSASRILFSFSTKENSVMHW